MSHQAGGREIGVGETDDDVPARIDCCAVPPPLGERLDACSTVGALAGDDGGESDEVIAVHDFAAERVRDAPGPTGGVDDQPGGQDVFTAVTSARQLDTATVRRHAHDIY